MIDLHVHILPGLDDGAEDLSEALEMAELACESGVKRLVATPHSNQEGRFENYYTDSLWQVYTEFCREVRKERISLQVDLGMEIFTSEDMQQKVLQRRLIGLNSTPVYLVEFPFEAEGEWMGEQLSSLLKIYKKPLIAHPERYACVQEFPEFAYEWLQMGCLTQLNRGSALGRFGKKAQRAAEDLLENNLVTCIASDAHGSCIRTTYMEDIWNYLEQTYGEDTAYRLMQENPQNILERRPIPAHGNMPERKRRFFW